MVPLTFPPDSVSKLNNPSCSSGGRAVLTLHSPCNLETVGMEHHFPSPVTRLLVTQPT